MMSRYIPPSGSNPAAVATRGNRRRLSERDAHQLLARAYQLHKVGQLFEALPLYVQVLESYPQHPVALHYAALLGRSLYDRARESPKAKAISDAVVRLMSAAILAAPDNAGCLHNLAKLHHDRGELDQAGYYYRAAVRYKPSQGESWTNLGNIYGELGDREKAEQCWRHAIDCPTGDADSAYNLSFLKLLKGDYAAGWPAYEMRLQSPGFQLDYGRPELTAPKWDGVRPGTIYVHQEQGAGDAIMMARYLPLVLERAGPGGRVVIEVVAGLASLFQSAFSDCEVVVRGASPPAHDFQVSMLSLPAVFGTTLATVPHPGRFPIIRGENPPDPANPGRIGLCWRGSTVHTNDRIRSMLFEAAFPLLDLAASHRLTFQSLQFGYDVSAPLDACPTGDFLETARAIARCDLVISVDTSIAHLAASMGVETWILLPHHAEWRWLQDREDSPWYPAARLWRQSAAGDWPGLIARVVDELSQRHPHV